MYYSRYGFTLVELAIVMTIIGLLIGGVLKGQELLENSRMTATAAQVKSYSSAVTTFRDIYKGLPGDLPNAANFIKGCSVNCNPLASTAGDMIIHNNWSASWAGNTTNPMSLPPASDGAETTLFWVHLYLAELITGVTNAAIVSATTPAWNTTHPATKLAGGFVVGSTTGGNTAGSPAAAGTGPYGIILALLATPISSVSVGATGAGILTPSRALQMDLKADDGIPNTGEVHAYGITASCFAGSGPYNYAPSVGSTDCGLIFRLQ